MGGELRGSWTPLTDKEVFLLQYGETEDTLKEGRLVEAKVRPWEERVKLMRIISMKACKRDLRIYGDLQLMAPLWECRSLSLAAMRSSAAWLTRPSRRSSSARTSQVRCVDRGGGMTYVPRSSLIQTPTRTFSLFP